MIPYQMVHNPQTLDRSGFPVTEGRAICAEVADAW